MIGGWEDGRQNEEVNWVVFHPQVYCISQQYLGIAEAIKRNESRKADVLDKIVGKLWAAPHGSGRFEKRVHLAVHRVKSPWLASPHPVLHPRRPRPANVSDWPSCQ